MPRLVMVTGVSMGIGKSTLARNLTDPVRADGRVDLFPEEELFTARDRRGGCEIRVAGVFGAVSVSRRLFGDDRATAARRARLAVRCWVLRGCGCT